MKPEERKEITRRISIFKENILTDRGRIAELKDMLKEAEKEPRFYKGQPCIFSYNADFSAADRDILLGIDKCRAYPYQSENFGCFQYCEPDLEAKSQLNWIEHNGNCSPVSRDVIVIVLLENGAMYSGSSMDYNWDTGTPFSAITHYAIIERLVYFD